MKNKRNTRKILIAAIVVLSVVLALLVGLAVYLIKGEDTPTPSEGTTGLTEPAGTETVPVSSETAPYETEPAETKPVPTTEPVADMVISTPFCDLHFPEQWKEMLRTEFMESDNGGAVVFTGIVEEKEAQLFVVLFSRDTDGQGAPLGAVKVDGEYVLVSLLMEELGGDWSDEADLTFAAMQESVNHLIQYLRSEPGFSGDTSLVVPEEQQDAMQIETPCVKLVYPGQWKDQVTANFTAEGDGGFVTFTGNIGGEDAKLFVIHFGTGAENAIPLGYVKADGSYVQVSLQMFEPDGADWSEEEHGTFAAMQEGFNDLFEALKKEACYTANPGTAEIPGETEAPGVTEVPADGDQSISTPYGELWIPAQWKNQMRAETRKANGGYTVTFIGKSGTHEVELFTILYGAETDSSFPVGTLDTDNGTMDVFLELVELDMDNWSDEDKDAINAMQESVNEVLQQLSETPGFKAG